MGCLRKSPDVDDQLSSWSDSDTSSTHLNTAVNQTIEEVVLDDEPALVSGRKLEKVKARRAQFDDVIENSAPFWFVVCTTRYHKRVLAGACLFYLLMIGLCVGLQLLNLAEVSDADFWIAGSRASNGVKMASSGRWEPWRLEPFID